MIRVRSANVDDAPAWLRMREALWPEAESASHAREIDEFFAGKLSMPLAALIALDDRKPVGFAELSIRNYAEDCVTDRVDNSRAGTGSLKLRAGAFAGLVVPGAGRGRWRQGAPGFAAEGC